MERIQKDQNDDVSDLDASLQFTADFKESDPVLDVAFYKTYYQDLRDLTDELAREHWLQFGYKEERFPSLEALVQTKKQLGDLPADFYVNTYKFLNPNLHGILSSDLDYIEHYIAYGSAERRKYAISDDIFMQDLYPVESGGIERALADGLRVYRNTAEMLERNGILTSDVISFFNATDYLTISGERHLSNDLQCLRHFCEIGRESLLPISLDHWFDPVFYQEHAKQATAPAAVLYLHWLNHGLSAGLKPNASKLMRDLGLRNTARFPPNLDPVMYRCLNTDLETKLATRWDVLAHVICFGLFERRPGRPAPSEATDLYLAAADRLVAESRLADAKTLYEDVLSVDPRNAFALQHYSDCLYRMGSHEAAIVWYQHLQAIDHANLSTYFNLTDCYRIAQRYRDAVNTLNVISARLPGDVGIRRYRREIAIAEYEQRQNVAATLGRSGFLPQAQAVAAEAAEYLSAVIATGSTDTIRTHGPIRQVVIVAEMSLPQCRFYRVEQKAEQLRHAGLAVTILDCSGDVQTIIAAVTKADAVIFYRVAAIPGVLQIIHAVREAGIVSFYDIDDLIFEIEHYPDSFESYGGQIEYDEYVGLVTGTGLFRAAMAACDYGLASTTALAERVKPMVRSGTCFVHRNALSQLHIRCSAKPNERDHYQAVSIFYGSGTKAHNEDFEELVAPALKRILENNSTDIHIYLMGYLTIPDTLKPYASRITQLPPVWDLQTYWSILSTMDINIAVLKRTVMTDCKSEIKWMEAGMFGIPSIVSRTAAYEEAVRDQTDGLLVETSEDWFRALTKLIDDQAARLRIGAAARTRIFSRYGTTKSAENLSWIFKEIGFQAKSSNKTRILIVHVFYPPQSMGGATRVVADNVRDILELYGDAFEIEVFTTTEGGERPYQTRAYRHEGVRVTALTAGSAPDIDMRAWDQEVYKLFDAHVAEFQPHIIHFHCIQRLSGSVCQVARDRHIPYYVTVHDGWWISDRQFIIDSFLKTRLYWQGSTTDIIKRFGPAEFQRMTELGEHLRAAEAVLAVSESFAKIYRGCGFRNVVTIANGVSAFDVYPRVKSPSGRVRIGHIGGTAPHKGLNLLKAAVLQGNFCNLELVVVDLSLPLGVVLTDLWGTTPVRYVAKLPQSDVGRLYAEIDVLAAPSIWPESYGLVVREALVAGCWVVVSDRGALAEDVVPGNGFVVDAQGTAALKKALAKIDRNPGKYLSSPRVKALPRQSVDQARELAALYKRRLASQDSALREVEVAVS